MCTNNSSSYEGNSGNDYVTNDDNVGSRKFKSEFQKMIEKCILGQKKEEVKICETPSAAFCTKNLHRILNILS